MTSVVRLKSASTERRRVHAASKPCGRIWTPHALEDAVTPALQGKMQLPAQRGMADKLAHKELAHSIGIERLSRMRVGRPARSSEVRTAFRSCES